MAKDDILSFYDIIAKHGMMQCGINYGKGKKTSVILMSGRKDAPYVDKEFNNQIIYEGEDVFGSKEKKTSDQELERGNKDLFNAALDYMQNKRGAEATQVYEKLGSGKWIDRGFFNLVGASKVFDGNRYVYRFTLSAGNEKTELVETAKDKNSRNIPSDVQIEVYKRDHGTCVNCGSKEKLHFDHIIPFSRGGSNEVENIQILCAKCNLTKSNKIGGEPRTNTTN